MGAKAHDVHLSHSGRDIAKKRDESKGGVRIALATQLTSDRNHFDATPGALGQRLSILSTAANTAKLSFASLDRKKRVSTLA